jgi:hypothetical protein
MNTYIPQAGTPAARAVKFIAAMEPRARLSTGEICERLNLDSNTLSVCLASAVRHGVVAKERRGRLLFWGPGDGKPVLEPRLNPAEEMQQRTVPAPNRDPSLQAARPRVPTAFDLAPRLEAVPALEEDDDDGECRNLDAPPLLAAVPSVPKPRLTVSEVLARQTPPAPAPAPQATRFALWSDKTLQVMRENGEIVELAPDETRGLFRYLDELRLRVDIEEEA